MKRHIATFLVPACFFLFVACQSREAYRLAEMASHYERADRFRAVTAYEQAVKISPNDPYLLTRAGLANLDAGQREAAIAHLKKAQELAPSYLDALQGLARAYAAVQDTQRAVEVLKRLFVLSSGDAATTVEVGITYRGLGRSEEALQAFGAALKANPGLYQVHAEIGMLYYERRNYDEAAQAYKTALHLNPYDARTMNNLAWMYVEQGILLDDALDLSTLSLQLDPDQPAYLDTLAEICYRKGNSQRAIALIRRAISIDPNTKHYRKQLRKFLTAGQKV